MSDNNQLFKNTNMALQRRVLTKNQQKWAKKKARAIELYEQAKAENNGVAPRGTYMAIAEILKVTDAYVGKVVREYERKGSADS